MVPALTNPKPVLLVDDSPDDALLLRRAFRRAAVPNPIVHLSGVEGDLEGFKPLLKQKDCGEPALILLDIKMPLLDGFEVLKWVKSKPDLANIPAVMLTSSDLEEDKLRAKNLGADWFLTKPQNFREYHLMAMEIHSRWLRPSE